MPVIASGGVGTLEDLVAGVRDGHASAVLAASVFHFGTYTIADAKKTLAEAGIAIMDNQIIIGEGGERERDKRSVERLIQNNMDGREP